MTSVACTSNPNSLEFIESGCKPAGLDFDKTNGETTKRLLGDSNGVPGEDTQKSKEKKNEPKAVFADAFGGECEVVYDDEDWQSDDEDDDDVNKKKKEMRAEAEETSWLAKIVFGVQGSIKWVNGLLQKVTKGYFWSIFVLVSYFVYFALAMNYSFGDEASVRLLVFTAIGLVVLIRHRVVMLAKRCFLVVNGSDHLSSGRARSWRWFKFGLQWTLNLSMLVFMVYVIVDVGIQDIHNLRSLPGLAIFLVICLLFSTNPRKVDWHIVYWSMGLQFFLAFIALKGEWGKDGVLWVQSRLDEFFSNSKTASELIFGKTYEDHYMVFAALPLIFMMNATLVLLYYLGAMQLVTKTLGNGLNLILHTSPVECIAVAGGIFLEGGIIILTLRPFLGSLSKSEMFVVITSGLASLGGTYVAMLAGLDVSLKFIIPAMLVSAPATFAVCKLMVPENLESKHGQKNNNIDDELGNEEKEKYSNALDAVQGGAISVLALLGNVIAVAFVFFSYISWVNHTLEWFGERVGVENLSLELIFSYVLYPVSMIMGVAFEDCRRVAMLLGYRLGSTNIIAFFKLREMKMNKVLFSEYMLETNNTGPISYYRDDIMLDNWNKTLTNGFLTDRSEAIVTYCLCGFSSAISAGIIMSFIIALVPKRRKWLTKMTFPAIVAGNIANCMTGCFASIFY